GLVHDERFATSDADVNVGPGLEDSRFFQRPDREVVPQLLGRYRVTHGIAVNLAHGAPNLAIAMRSQRQWDHRSGLSKRSRKIEAGLVGYAPFHLILVTVRTKSTPITQSR